MVGVKRVWGWFGRIGETCTTASAEPHSLSLIGFYPFWVGR